MWLSFLNFFHSIFGDVEQHWASEGKLGNVASHFFNIPVFVGDFNLTLKSSALRFQWLDHDFLQPFMIQNVQQEERKKPLAGDEKSPTRVGSRRLIMMQILVTYWLLIHIVKREKRWTENTTVAPLLPLSQVVTIARISLQQQIKRFIQHTKRTQIFRNSIWISAFESNSQFCCFPFFSPIFQSPEFYSQLNVYKLELSVKWNYQQQGINHRP